MWRWRSGGRPSNSIIPADIVLHHWVLPIIYYLIQ
jgi:hypothetical protein